MSLSSDSFALQWGPDSMSSARGREPEGYPHIHNREGLHPWAQGESVMVLASEVSEI